MLRCALYCCLQVKPLVIRHIKYGVKAEYIQRLSCVTTCVLRCALGGNYNPEAEAAWSYAWGSVSRCLAESLANGINLVTIALVCYLLHCIQDIYKQPNVAALNNFCNDNK
jgi:hypothetical protein